MIFNGVCSITTNLSPLLVPGNLLAFPKSIVTAPKDADHDDVRCELWY